MAIYSRPRLAAPRHSVYNNKYIPSALGLHNRPLLHRAVKLSNTNNTTLYRKRIYHLFKAKNTILHFFLHIAPNLLLLIFAESAVGFVQSEEMAVGIITYCLYILYMRYISIISAISSIAILKTYNSYNTYDTYKQKPLPLSKGGDRGEGMSI